MLFRLMLPCILSAGVFAQEWTFTDVTESAGLQFKTPLVSDWAGVSASDYDGDGHVDLLLTRIGVAPQLFRNKGDGSFEDVAAQAGITTDNLELWSSLFFDYDGDGDLDVLGLYRRGNSPSLWRNNGDGSFEDVSNSIGITLSPGSVSAAAGDYDRDGDVDVYVAVNHPDKEQSQLLRNNGDGTFSHVANELGILPFEGFNLEFSPAFVDLNNDFWPDLTVVSDFNNTAYYLNNGDGTFVNATTDVITDEGGMGSALGDYDNDGDMDWFVSSIWDPEQNPFAPWGVSSGNRLYRNIGNGLFEDATDEAGVRDGMWGWGSVFEDFNADGSLDIFHTNGFIDLAGPHFRTDPSRFFLNNGSGVFTEMATSLGLDDQAIGNGVATFDYDGDGDVDLFVANSDNGASKLFRNDLNSPNKTLRVRLVGEQNTQALGSRIYLSLTGRNDIQMREVSAANHFMSHSSSEVYFGMGEAPGGVLEVTWQNEKRFRLYDIVPGERLVLPELPVSFDDESISFYAYLARTRTALASHVADGTISAADASRIRASAVKAFLLHRYPAIAD